MAVIVHDPFAAMGMFIGGLVFIVCGSLFLWVLLS